MLPKDDYQPFVVMDDGEPTKFEGPDKDVQSSIKEFFGYKDGIESLVLKKGCRATLYIDSECTMKPFVLKSETSKDLVIPNLGQSTASDYGKSDKKAVILALKISYFSDKVINCIKCNC